MFPKYQDRERIKRQIAESIQASLRVGTRELWQRLYKVVSHMSARMTEYNTALDGSKPRLYDSMITNIVEIVDVLPKPLATRNSTEWPVKSASLWWWILKSFANRRRCARTPRKRLQRSPSGWLPTWACRPQGRSHEHRQQSSCPKTDP